MGKARNEIFLKKIALNVKKIRELKGITQEVFYNDTGINIGRIERAKRDFSMTTLKVICAYLEITISNFFKDLE
ncbi:MAG: helix-turn-helix domain-containing protein [Bacteroidota bacterium]